jgi:hypothetical protein
MDAVVMATVFMGVSSLAVAVAFHAMRGMYLHAERLLAKAGRQGAREGYLPSGARRRTSEAKVCTSEARKTVGKPLAPRQGSALSEVWFPYACASSAQELSGSRCGRNRPLRRVAEDAQRLETGEEGLLPTKAWISRSSEPIAMKRPRNWGSDGNHCHLEWSVG